jgi:glycosyltransferase involved in cell wall biosynthesis
MPTRNRRLFVNQAIKYFLRQDYCNKELIVIDDGEDKIRDLIPDIDKIKYIPLNAHKSIGEKRNLACSLSQGEFIAHFDDDDWMARSRISHQVEALINADADVCGSRNLLHYHVFKGEAWGFNHPQNGSQCVAGSTLMYRKSAWKENPFPEDAANEITPFIKRFNPDQIHSIDSERLYVAIIHRRNSHPKNPAGRYWRRLPFDALDQLFKSDGSFYLSLRNGSFLRQPNASAVKLSPVNLVASFLIYDGYGSMAEYLAMGMKQAGAKVNLLPLTLDKKGLSDELQMMLKGSRPGLDGPILYFCWPNPELDRYLNHENLFINTMWESSRLPRTWPEKLNRSRAVIVPTRFVAGVCRDSGVKVPIEVVSQGIDPDVYNFIKRPRRAGLTTLIVGTVIGRKNVKEGIEAWKIAFEKDSDARLIIKARFGYNNYTPDDDRIRYIDINETTRGIAHWYEKADVLLALGNEGFGLPLVEAMATGLPAIALDSEGQSDICEEAGELILSVKPCHWKVCDTAQFGKAGVRGIPDPEDIASKLQWINTHREEACAMGLAASKWVRSNRDIWTMGPAVLKAMEHHSRPSRILRHAYTVWVPSWKTHCGISEYTAHLQEHLSNIRITGSPPDPYGSELIHIQHEHSLFDDAQLTEQIRRFRKLNLDTIVTEHAVLDRPAEWEKESDILVALTPDGTEMLRKRWPGKRIEHIPHGCPTWFPPRKKSVGKVIGTFGFLEHYKGFWKLLEVLRELEGSELLMFSYAKSAQIEAEWNLASRGLPVQRIADFLPAREIARRLASRADILVFWYDDKPLLSVSGAVRVGLATGVPVLVSSSKWFWDVKEATYQPDNLVEGIRRLIEDRDLRNQLSEAARDFCFENSWENIARRHVELWQSLF